MKELTPPSHFIREFACSEKAATTAAASRTALHRILHGQDDRVMVVIGPCS
ncbi:MAG TPA: 3-deoxy-7-phosphoheptulonate synthase, partial [Oxalobacteraceae bacterium]|nr:3-deoxy-7-phosphoheptulonate synthase [Oxalobacteraceae bacterium]